MAKVLASLLNRLLDVVHNRVCHLGENRQARTERTPAVLRFSNIGVRGFPKILSTPVQPLPP